MEKSPEFFDGFLNVKSRVKLRNIRSGALSGAIEKAEKINENGENAELKLYLELLDMIKKLH